VEGELSFREVPEVVRCVLPCTLEAADDGIYLSVVLEVPEIMRRVLLCMLEAVEGEVCLLEVLEVLNVLEAAAGDTLYAGGCGIFEFPLWQFSHQSATR